MNEYRFYLTGEDASTWRRLVGRYYWLPDSQIITHLVEVHGLSCKDYCSLDSAHEANDLGGAEFTYEDPEDETELFTSIVDETNPKAVDENNSTTLPLDVQDFFCQPRNNSEHAPANLDNQSASTSAEQDKSGQFHQGTVMTQNISDSTQRKDQAAVFSDEQVPILTQRQESALCRAALCLSSEQLPSVTQAPKSNCSDTIKQTLSLSAESGPPPTQCNTLVLPISSNLEDLPNHSQTDQLNSTSHGPMNSTSQGPLNSTSHGPMSSDNHGPLNPTSHGSLSCASHGPLSAASHGPLSSASPAVHVKETVPSGVVEPTLYGNSDSVGCCEALSNGENLQSTTTGPFMPVIVSVESLSKVTEKESPAPDKSVAVPVSHKQVLGIQQAVVVLLKNKINQTRIGDQFTETDKNKGPSNQESVIKNLLEKKQGPNTGISTTADNPHEAGQPGEDSLLQESNPLPAVDQSDSSDPGYRSAKAPSEKSSPVKKKTIPKPSRKSLEFGTKYPSPSKDTEAEGKQKNRKGNSKMKRRPDRFCVYCKQVVKGGRITDHMSRKHKSEPEVQAILKKPFEVRMKFFTAKRREGNYLYNLHLMDKGKNQPLMKERTQIRNKEDEIKVCTDCKGFYSKRCFFRHLCVADGVSQDTRRIRRVFMENMDEDTGFQSILSRFVHGEIDEFCKSNISIKTMGYQYYNTHRTKKGMREEARQTTIADMRELSRLFFHFRIICASGKAVEDMFDRDNMKELMDAMKLLEALNGSSDYTETGTESALYNVVLRMLKSLDEFYTDTRQFDLKRELSKFKQSFTSKIKRITVKNQTRTPGSAAHSESSSDPAVETDTEEENSASEHVSTTEEASTELGTTEGTSTGMSGRKQSSNELSTGRNTCEDVSYGKPVSDEESSEQGISNSTSSRISNSRPISGPGSSDDASSRLSGGKPISGGGAREVCASNDASPRKSVRKPVPKQFPDHTNDSAKKIRLESVLIGAERETDSCPIERIGRCSVKWSREETNLLRRYFQSYIYIHTDKEDNTGNLPGKKEVQAFLKSHSIGCIKELNEKTQIQKIRTKIFNERKTSRERGWKRLREITVATLSVK